MAGSGVPVNEWVSFLRSLLCVLMDVHAGWPKWLMSPRVPFGGTLIPCCDLFVGVLYLVGMVLFVRDGLQTTLPALKHSWRTTNWRFAVSNVEAQEAKDAKKAEKARNRARGKDKDKDKDKDGARKQLEISVPPSPGRGLAVKILRNAVETSQLHGILYAVFGLMVCGVGHTYWYFGLFSLQALEPHDTMYAMVGFTVSMVAILIIQGKLIWDQFRELEAVRQAVQWTVELRYALQHSAAASKEASLSKLTRSWGILSASSTAREQTMWIMALANLPPHSRTLLPGDSGASMFRRRGDPKDLLHSELAAIQDDVETISALLSTDRSPPAPADILTDVGEDASPRPARHGHASGADTPTPVAFRSAATGMEMSRSEFSSRASEVITQLKAKISVDLVSWVLNLVATIGYVFLPLVYFLAVVPAANMSPTASAAATRSASVVETLEVAAWWGTVIGDLAWTLDPAIQILLIWRAQRRIALAEMEMAEEEEKPKTE